MVVNYVSKDMPVEVGRVATGLQVEYIFIIKELPLSRNKCSNKNQNNVFQGKFQEVELKEFM